MSDLISRISLKQSIVVSAILEDRKTLEQIIDEEPTIDAVPVVRCKDCIHQQKVFHEDKRIKEGGHYIYGCELADGYSHVCLDDDYCSRSERRTDG